METIKNLALASEAFRVFVPGKRISQSVYESMQRHANYTAAIAGVLPIEPKTREITVVSALLHDIGSLVLASAMPEQFCAAQAVAAERGCRVFEAEEELLGTSHAEIGAYLLGLWGIPNLAVEAIAFHHRPMRIPHTGIDCTASVYLASYLANELEAHPQGTTGLEVEESERENMEALEILPRIDDFRELAMQVKC
jgi:HD-like signal output (HDOD) protein